MERTGTERIEKPPATLGDVLYAKIRAPAPEEEWSALVRAIALSDQLALHALYERAHRPVFTLVMRLTANREIAEELTVDVFHDVWRCLALRRGERDGARMDHESGAIAGDRSVALREPKKAQP